MGRRYRLGVRPTHKPVVLYIRNKPRMRVSSKPSPRQPPPPPHGVVNDGNFAHLYSGNTMYDPGADLFVGNAVGEYAPRLSFRKILQYSDDPQDPLRAWSQVTGISPYTLPRFDPDAEVGQVWPSGEDVSYYDIAQWMQLGGTYNATGRRSDAAWKVTREDAYAGRYSMVWRWWWADQSYLSPAPLCVQAPGLPGGYSARVVNGDRVTFGTWARIAGVYSTGVGGVWYSGTPELIYALTFYTQAGGAIATYQQAYDMHGATQPYAHNPVTSRPPWVQWNWYSISTVAPPSSYFVRATVNWIGEVRGNINVWYPFLDPPPDSGYVVSAWVDSGILAVE